MWYELRTAASQAEPELAAAMNELLQSTSRHIILATGLVYLSWHLIGTVTWPGTVGRSAWLVTPLVVLTFALALWLLPRRLLAAQAVWQVGLAAAITVAVHVFQRHEAAFFYALLPLMAVVTVGWPGGLLAETLVAGLTWWLSRTSSMPPLPATYGPIIVAGGAFSGLLGWATGRALLTVTQWSLFSFAQARQNIEEAREQRLELKQIQEDLIHANQELTRLSDRLKAMHQVAEEARRAKEEFVANVSHELRTPLNMIIGFSEAIPQASQVYGIKLPPPLLADIAAIRRNSQHLSRLIDDVLDLSQLEAGRTTLSREWVSVAEIVETAATAVRALFDSKTLYLETEIAPDLPPIFCDQTRVRQVMLNLLSNAGRFTERGGVRVRAWRAQDAVVISVTDTGPGISPENQSRLFEPFQQLDGSIRRRHGGSGLGLSISKRFVEMHGGKMWVESQVGVGTTFYFSLPLEPPLPAVPADDMGRWFSPYRQYEPRTRRSKAPAPTVAPRYVILEQEDTLQRLFSRYVQGVETVAVHTVEEAIAELNRSPAQALIVNAPSLQEAPGHTEQLNKLPYGTPAIICWAPGENEAARRLGVVRYLVKPIPPETLLAAVEELGSDVQSVLLVDDEPEVLQLFSRVLSSSERGYRVLRAQNGRRALSLLRERRPDVVLLDLIMPGMDGFRVLEEKRQDPTIRDIPVVVISSRDPSGQPIVSETLSVMRGGGLSALDLLACIQTITNVLVPSVQPAGREPPETPPG